MSGKEQELAVLRKQQKLDLEKKIAYDSRERLKRTSTKKFKTSFIFPISEFETAFGLELWGHGLPEDQISSIQKANRKRWQQVRTNILNNGNIQRRAMEAEIDLHEVRFIGYQMDLVKENGDGRK